MDGNIEATRRGVRWMEFCAMGAAISVVLEDEEHRAMLQEIPRWFMRWDRCLNRFFPHSELSRLNADAGRPRKVSATLWSALETALCAAHWSEGLVVPTFLDAIELSGYDRSTSLLGEAPPSSVERITRQATEWRRIHADPATRTVTLPSTARVDLGGVARAWAADRASARLAAFGPSMIDVGGAVAISAPRRTGAPWPVVVADPRTAGRELKVLHVLRGGVATVGRDFRKWQQGGAWKEQVIDPSTRRTSATDVLTATVLAETAVEADVAAKSIVLRGAREGLRWVEHQEGLSAIVVTVTGEVRMSERVSPYVAA
jgi:FAD:protein FMN transferase